MQTFTVPRERLRVQCRLSLPGGRPARSDTQTRPPVSLPVSPPPERKIDTRWFGTDNSEGGVRSVRSSRHLSESQNSWGTSMRSVRWFLIGWVLLACCEATSAGAPLDESKDAREAKRAVQVQLRSRFVMDRTSGVRRLAEFPPMDGARLILQLGLTDPEQEVRQAASRTLLAWKDDREVCNHLLKILEKDVRSKNGPSVATPILAVLLASELPEIQARLSKFLDGYVAKSRDGIFVVGAVIDQLGMQGDAAALAPLRALLKQKCIGDTYACRRAVDPGHDPRPPTGSDRHAVGLLPRLDGEVRGDVIRHLETISGQQLGLDAKAWQAWWKEKGEGFEFPANPGGLPLVGNAPQGVSSYYGLSLYAKRIVFVIDTSGEHGRATVVGRQTRVDRRRQRTARRRRGRHPRVPLPDQSVASDAGSGDGRGQAGCHVLHL